MRGWVGILAAAGLCGCGGGESDNVEVTVTSGSAAIVGPGAVAVGQIGVIGTYGTNRWVNSEEIFFLELKDVPVWATPRLEASMIRAHQQVPLSLQISASAPAGAEAMVQVCASTESKRITACSGWPLQLN